LRYEKYRGRGVWDKEAKKAFKERYGVKNFKLPFTASDIIPDEKLKLVYSEYIDRYGLTQLIRIANDPPFCILTTIFQIKGGEAENVCIFHDATPAVQNNLLFDLDCELRVYYTSITRAKENVYLVYPDGKRNTWILSEQLLDTLSSANTDKDLKIKFTEMEGVTL
jgi:superfamily I DNA/RNA helicase